MQYMGCNIQLITDAGVYIQKTPQTEGERYTTILESMGKKFNLDIKKVAILFFRLVEEKDGS